MSTNHPLQQLSASKRFLAVCILLSVSAALSLTYLAAGLYEAFLSHSLLTLGDKGTILLNAILLLGTTLPPLIGHWMIFVSARGKKPMKPSGLRLLRIYTKVLIIVEAISLVFSVIDLLFSKNAVYLLHNLLRAFPLTLLGIGYIIYSFCFLAAKLKLLTAAENIATFGSPAVWINGTMSVLLVLKFVILVLNFCPPFMEYRLLILFSQPFFGSTQLLAELLGVPLCVLYFLLLRDFRAQMRTYRRPSSAAPSDNPPQ